MIYPWYTHSFPRRRIFLLLLFSILHICVLLFLFYHARLDSWTARSLPLPPHMHVSLCLRFSSDLTETRPWSLPSSFTTQTLSQIYMPTISHLPFSASNHRSAPVSTRTSKPMPLLSLSSPSKTLLRETHTHHEHNQRRHPVCPLPRTRRS